MGYATRLIPSIRQTPRAPSLPSSQFACYKHNRPTPDVAVYPVSSASSSPQWYKKSSSPSPQAYSFTANNIWSGAICEAPVLPDYNQKVLGHRRPFLVKDAVEQMRATLQSKIHSRKRQKGVRSYESGQLLSCAVTGRRDNVKDDADR